MKNFIYILIFLLFLNNNLFANNFNKLFYEAENYYLNNEIDKSLNLFNKLKNQINYDNDIKGYTIIYLGKIYIDKNNYKNSIYLFNNIINGLYNDNIKKISYMYLTRIYLTKNNFNPEKAINYSLKANKIDNKDYDIIFYIAKSYFKYALAIKEKIIKSNEDYKLFLKKSIYYLNICIKNKNKLNYVKLNYTLSLMAQNYSALENYEKSIYYFNLSLNDEFNENISDTKFWTEVNYAHYLLFKKKEYNKANLLYDELLDYVRKNKKYTYITNEIKQNKKMSLKNIKN